LIAPSIRGPIMILRLPPVRPVEEAARTVIV